MKVTIKKWSAVAAWRWDMPEEDMCGICRNPYDSTCSKCKFPGDECPLLMGGCNHTFHIHCIEAWLRQDQSQGKCPMCRQPFEAKKESEPTQARAIDPNSTWALHYGSGPLPDQSNPQSTPPPRAQPRGG